MACMCIGSQRAAQGLLGHRSRYGPAIRASRPARRVTATPMAFFSKKGGARTVKRETVIPEPSFAVPAGALAIAGAAAYAGAPAPAAVVGVLGAFLAIQATRVRFKFDDDALEVVIGNKEEKKTENAFVGGANRWRYDTFVNWEMWWPGFPILVYFKETQTKPEGQIHFFPVLFNGKQLYDVMLERCGPTQNSGPKQ